MSPTKKRTERDAGAVAPTLVPDHKMRRPAEGERFGGFGHPDKAELLRLLASYNVRFLRLQFIDVMGVLKNVEVPQSRCSRARWASTARSR
jgi:hypothetical protein